MTTLRAAWSAVLFSVVAVAVHAAIDPALQMQTGNPSAALATPGNPSDPGNHDHYLIQRGQYALDFSDHLGDPNWVAWDLTNADLGSVSRSNFLPDPDLPAGFYPVSTDDYNGVGTLNFNRGHMCPSADRNATTTDNQIVFYMTNIVPQSADNNQGPWELLESYERQLATAGNELLIMSGPSLFGGATIPSGKAAIPNYVWKIILVVPAGPGTAVSRVDANTRVIAVKMPNVIGIRSNPWTDYVVSVSEIENDTGYRFFTNLSTPVADALRVKVDSAGSGGTLPTITTQPVSQTVLAGSTVTFSVAGTGASLAYQWRKDGDAIAGAVNPTLTLTNVQAADAAGYDVVVSNSSGAVTSNLATLTISPPIAPAITTQPTNQTASVGGTASFSVVATGLPAPTYQWSNIVTGPISGATGATLTLSAVQVSDAGGYFVTVTNSAGAVTSSVATLTVVSTPPTITTQPQSQSVSLGGSVTFAVAATGSAPLTYQWRKNGSPVAGATSATLALSGIQASDGGSYDVVVTNAAGSVASNLAVLTVGANTNTLVFNFGTSTSLTASPTSPVPSDITVTPLVSGNSFGTTTLLSTTSASSGYTNTGGAVVASGAGNAGVAARIGALNKAAGGSAYFEVTLTPAAGKQLTISGVQFGSRSTPTAPQAIDIYSSVDGFASRLATTPLANTSVWFWLTPAFTPVTGTVGGSVTLRLYGYNGSGNPGSGTINWRIDDLNIVVSTGGALAPTVAVSATSPAANASNVGVASPISVTFNQAVNVVGSWFTIASAANGPVAATSASADGKTFTLTPTTNFAYSDTINVVLNAAQIADQATGTAHPTSNYAFTFGTAAPTPPAIVTPPLSQAVIVGGTVSFTVGATGTAPLSYQWRKDGAPLADGGIVSGATTNTLTLAGVGLGDAGNYDVVVNNVVNAPVTSSAAVLIVSTVPIAPSIVTPPQSQSVALGGTATFSVVAGGTTPLSYQWRKNGVNLVNGSGISGATSATVTVAGVSYLSAGNYDVVVTNSASPSATSAPATLTVNTATGTSVVYFTGADYTQNFDTLPKSGTFTFAGNGPYPLDAAPANGGVGATGLTGWSFAKANAGSTTARFNVDTGASNAGSAYSYGSSAATDRALGSLASSSVVSRFGVILVNATGQTITQFTLGYTGEQWRRGGSGNPSTLGFEYAVGGADIGTGSFTAAAALNFGSVNTTGGSAALDGNAAANRAIVASQISGLSWAPGQTLVLRWTSAATTTSDGLAIDDLVFTTASAAAPTITVQPVSQTATVGDTVSFTAAATGTPAPAYQWRKDGVALVNGGGISGATSPTLTLTNLTTANAGVYDLLATNGISPAAASAPATLTVNKAVATVTLGNLTQTYDGTPRFVTTTTAPANLPVVLTYDGSTTAPTNAGSYAVLATVDDPNYTGSANGTLTVQPIVSVITWPAPSPIVYGTALGATQLNATANTVGTFTYAPPAGTVLGAGADRTLSVSFTPTDATNYTSASATTTITVEQAPAAIAFADLDQMYDGTPKPVTVTTTPAGLAVTVTYNGSATPPRDPGAYAVVATIDDANYTGTAAATLNVGITALVRHAPTIDGSIDGSVQVLSGESFALNGNAWVSDDLLVPGLPTVRLNGRPTLAGTIDGVGNTAPSNYQITLNGNALVRYIVRRTDPIALPVVATPLTPVGTRNVTLNSTTQSAGDFSTVRNLTLNGNAGSVSVPAGTYGSFVANGNSTLVLGLANATAPSIYNLQSLTVNGNAAVRVVGPVVINLATGANVNGSVGDAAHPEWLALNVANGGVTLNGSATAAAFIVAPSGAVILNGGVHLIGHVAADRLTVNGGSSLESAP